MHDFSIDIRQSKIAAGVAVCQAFVVNSQRIQQCGVQVVHVDGVFDGMKTEVIGRAIGQTIFDATAGHPHRECLRVMTEDGYNGWHSLEWEKMWHPDLVGPDVALSLFPWKMRELWDSIPS